MREFYDLAFKDLVAKDYPNREFSIYSPGQIEELKTNMMTMVLKLGVIMSPDVLRVAVNQMVEHLVMEEYRYICDLFETVDYKPVDANGAQLFTEEDREIFKTYGGVKENGKMADRLPLEARKAVKKGKGKK